MENGQKSGMDFPQKGQVMSSAMREGVINLTRHRMSGAVTCCREVCTLGEPRPGEEMKDGMLSLSKRN